MRYVPVALLLFASTANAANWLHVADLDSKGSTLLVDTAGIARMGGVRKAWFKFAYTSDQPIPPGYDKSVPSAKFYRRELSLTYFDCTDRTLATAQSIARNAEDKVVAEFSTSKSSLRYREVPPETVSEQMLVTVCDWKFEGDKPVQPVPPAKLLPGAPTPAELELAGEPHRVALPADVRLSPNPDDFYPPGSKRREEQGSPVIKACVNPSGKLVRDPVVTDTSGFPELDGAAIKVAKASRYAAGTDARGTAFPESCVKFKVKFSIRAQ